MIKLVKWGFYECFFLLYAFFLIRLYEDSDFSFLNLGTDYNPTRIADYMLPFFLFVAYSLFFFRWFHSATHNMGLYRLIRKSRPMLMTLFLIELLVSVVVLEVLRGVSYILISFLYNGTIRFSQPEIWLRAELFFLCTVFTLVLLQLLIEIAFSAEIAVIATPIIYQSMLAIGDYIYYLYGSLSKKWYLIPNLSMIRRMDAFSISWQMALFFILLTMGILSASIHFLLIRKDYL